MKTRLQSTVQTASLFKLQSSTGGSGGLAAIGLKTTLNSESDNSPISLADYTNRSLLCLIHTNFMNMTDRQNKTRALAGPCECLFYSILL